MKTTVTANDFIATKKKYFSHKILKHLQERLEQSSEREITQIIRLEFKNPKLSAFLVVVPGADLIYLGHYIWGIAKFLYFIPSIYLGLNYNDFSPKQVPYITFAVTGVLLWLIADAVLQPIRAKKMNLKKVLLLLNGK